MSGPGASEPGRSDPGTSGCVVGVGIDAVEVPRLRALVARRPGVVARLWTDDEVADVARRSDPLPGLAVRFAAKEAAMKALGCGLGAFAFREAEVRTRPGGAPELVLSGRAAAVAAGRHVAAWHLSLSHTDSVAVAVAVAVG